MPYIVVENGNQRGTRIDLVAGEPLVLGRDPEAGLSLDDKLCSRHHCEFVVEGERVVLRDLGSSNGTFVDDERITELQLEGGANIVLGETHLSFQQDSGATGRGLVGKTIGGYRILDRIGRGGMGTVFKANQVSLDRDIALKILSPRVAADPAFVTKFKQEAQAAGALNHPNIVQVYDVGSDRDLHFYSMEYIENGSVQDLATREGQLDVGLALDVIIDAARGLEYAEKRGLVHRDIKPDNLMINAEGVVKIADLGLARSSGSGKDDGGIFGTPHFISPEQAQGRPVDTRSDIYSLGASFYRLVTGDTPFQGDSVRAIVQAQINEPPTPVRDKRRECPAAIAAIIEKMMAKDPEERHASATVLLEDLERVANQMEGGGKGKVLAAAAFMVVVVIGVVASGILGGDPEPDPNPDDGPTPVIDNGPDPEAQAELDRKQRLLAFQIALQTLQGEQQAAQPKSLEEITEWIGRYEALLGEHPEVAEAQESIDAALAPLRTRKTEIEQQATARAEAEARSKAAAEEAVTKALDAAKAAHDASRPGESLQVLVRALDAPVLRGRAEAAQVQTAYDERLAALKTSIERTRSTIETDLLAKGAFDEARTSARDAKRLLTEGVTDEDPRLDELKTLAASLDALLGRADEIERAQRAASLAADQQRFLAARKQALEAVSRGFDLSGAASAYEAIAADLETAPFKGLLAEDQAWVASAATIVPALVASWNDSRQPKTIELRSARDETKSVTWQVQGITADGLELKRSRFSRTLPFGELPRLELWERVLAPTLGNRPEMRDAMARVLLMTGDAAGARTVFGGQVPAELQVRLAAEERAWGRIQRIRELEGRVQGDDGAWLEMLPLTERFLAEDRRSFAFALHSNGQTPIFDD